MSNFKQQTVSGIKWGMLNNLFVQFFNMGVSVVLARLLLPEHFGAVGMVMVLTGFATVFFEMGFGHALIQKEALQPEDSATVFWFNLFMGILLFGVLFFSAPFVASFYETPIVASLARVLALLFIFNALNVVQLSLLKKALNFKKIAFVNVLATFISGITGIVLALYGFKVWAIVAQLLSLSGLKTLLYFIYNDWRPSFIFKWQALKSMLGFSASIAGDTMLTYWARNLDNLLIGKFIGGDALGLYTKAYSIMMLPIKNISQVINSVLFPSFSSIKQDLTKLKTVHLRILSAILLVVLPICCIIWLSAYELVYILFGNNWLDMVPLVQILTFLGISQSMLKINGALYLALGKAQLALKLSFYFQLVTFSLIILGLWLGGLYGLVIAYAFASILIFFPSFYFIGKQIQLTLLEFLKKAAPILISGCVMVIVTWLIDHYVIQFNQVVVSLLFKSSVASLSYVVMLMLFKVSIFYELIAIVRSQIKRKKK
ncbi:MAG: MOP flippase family protein [Vicingaceae bacterium]|nr:MOP flippase family protein [Vicingaceae bacterium]